MISLDSLPHCIQCGAELKPTAEDPAPMRLFCEVCEPNGDVMKEQDMCGGPITQAADQMIQGPLVLRFDLERFKSCKACGIGINFWDRLHAMLKGGEATVTNIRYCPGGKPPTESKGMMQAMMTGEVEVVNPCAGVYGPHLHCFCRRCGYAYLVATATDRL